MALQLPDSPSPSLERRQPANSAIEKVDEIIAFTASLFPGRVTVESSFDPEYPDAVYLVFRVALFDNSLSMDEIMDREILWHQQVEHLAPGSGPKARIVVE